MSAKSPRAPTVETVQGYRVQAAGYEWDAVRMPAAVGLAVLTVLGEQSGAVIDDPWEPALYWFVAPGATAAWDAPETRALSLGQHLVVPEEGRVKGPGPHWRIRSEGRVLLTDVAALRAALEVAAKVGHEIPMETR